MTSQLDVEKVAISYGAEPVVRDIGFSLEKGRIGCLLGPSGCGKTSLLRAIAGFEPVVAGQIRLAGQIVSRRGHSMAPEIRNVGMVFQDFALFPHLDAAANIAFGLRRWSAADRRARVAELLDLVGLPQSGTAFPHELSGGQQQRIALARAMAPRPGILLLDEPFSNIDTEMREQLASEVRAMLLRDGMTALLVTHDQLEAFAIADMIGVMSKGRLRQWDDPYRVYHRPADRFVADFIGEGAIIEGYVVDAGHVETELGPVAGALPASLAEPGRRLAVLLRPDDIIHDDNSPEKLPIVARTFRGSQYLYTLRLHGGEEIYCLAHSHHDHPPGQRIGVRLDVKHLTVFEEN